MIMYEYSWHHTTKGAAYVTVTPITIQSNEDGRITAIDHKGRSFGGWVDQFFETEEMAWEAAKQELRKYTEQLTDDISKLKEKLDMFEECLKNMEKHSVL